MSVILGIFLTRYSSWKCLTSFVFFSCPPPLPRGVPGEGPDCHFPKDIAGFGPIPARFRIFLILFLALGTARSLASRRSQVVRGVGGFKDQFSQRCRLKRTARVLLHAAMASLSYRALKLWRRSQSPAFEDSRIQSAIVVGLTVGEVLKLGLRPGGRLPVRVEAQEPITTHQC